MARAVKGYDRLAPYYEQLERLAFGSQLMRARTALLDNLPPLRETLILGEGDGRFLKAFLEGQPDCSVTVLEQSARMVELARNRLTQRQRARVRFLLGDAVTLGLDSFRYDLVVTAFFLDCFSREELVQVVLKIADSLKPGGWWLYADFATPPRGWRRARANAYLTAMHAFFRWQTGLQTWRLADPEPLFGRFLRLEERRDLGYGLLTCRLYRRTDPRPIVLWNANS